MAENANRARVMAVYNAVMSVSFGVGPLIIVVTGTTGWIPFLTADAIIVLTALLLPFAARFAPRVARDSKVRMWALIKEEPVLIAGVLPVAT